MSQYDIMHEHDNQRDACPPLPGAFSGCKTHRYVAIIEGLNHGLQQGIIESDAKPVLLRDYKKITLFEECWRA